MYIKKNKQLLKKFSVKWHKQNILTLPFGFFLELAAGDLWRGYPYNLVNGQYYLSTEVPKLYFLVSLIYKSPEYFIFCYIIFL